MADSYDPVRSAIRAALHEDIGFRDVTTETTVPPGLAGEAVLLAREDLVLAGLGVFEQVFREVDPHVVCRGEAKDGDRVAAGATICRLTGRLASILRGERTAVNFLQRMSGIATLTRRYVERVASTGAVILDTRKTAPGLRWFDKYAVRAGGGANHRFGLFDGILIKDNHIAAAGSITRAVGLAKERAPHTLKVEVEVEDLGGLQEALAAGADIILLDNMPPDQLRSAVAVTAGRAMLEASGGITLETVLAVAETGVDAVSVGALTHSARAVDVSLEIVPL
jgi:nicotinate-nucleotide pyrophosphorylase (carboxylating)